MKTSTATRILCLLLCAVLLAACGENGGKTTALYGKSDNEIYTYERIDPSRTQLVIGVAENDDVGALVQAFAEAYPDVQPLICYLQKGDLSYSPALEWIRHGYAPDVVFNVDFGADDPVWLEDLSKYDATGSFYAQALEENDRGGCLYTLPGPAKVMSIAYNKTLFEQYGWTVPQTFDEFLSLCDRITADTGGSVEPYNPNGKYATDFAGGMEAFAYGQLFAGTENRRWYSELQTGSATFAEHMIPYFEMLQKMSEHGLLTPDHFNYSYAARTKNFLNGQIAMINIVTDSGLGDGSAYEIGFMPFPSLDGGSRYLSIRQCFNLSVVRKERTAAQSKAVREFLNYFSTPEAQRICTGDTLMLSSVAGAQLSPDYPADLTSEISRGQYFKRLDFDGGKIPVTFSVLSLLRDEAAAIATGERTPAQAAADADLSLQKALEGGTAASESAAVADVKKDFTVLEFSEFIADAFRAKTGADIALIPDNSIYRGNIHRLFAGTITENMLSALTPRSLDNGSALVRVTMTGANLLAALNAPPGYTEQSAGCIYAFSGLKVTAAPWNAAGSRILSVTLSDGTAIDPDRTYTVAFWQGMVSDDLIAQTEETYDGSYADFLQEAFTGSGSLSPAADGRLKLRWD